MILYFNVHHPSNFQTFLQYFSSNIIALSYNPLDGLLEQQCNLPWAFQLNGNSCSFMENTGQDLFLISIGVLFKIVLAVLCKLMAKKPRVFKYLTIANNFLGPNMALIVIDTVMFDFLLAGFISLKSFSASTTAGQLDFSLAMLTILFYLAEISLIFYYCRTKYQQRNNLEGRNTTDPFALEERQASDYLRQGSGTKLASLESSEASKTKHSSSCSNWIRKHNIEQLLENMNVDFFTGRYCIFIDQSVMFLSVILLVFLFDYPFVQIGGIVGGLLCKLALFILKRPHSSFKENVRCLATESLLSTCMLLCMPLVSGSGVMTSVADRFYYFGYPMIGLSSALFLLSLTFSLYEAGTSIYQCFKNCKKKKKPQPEVDPFEEPKPEFHPLGKIKENTEITKKSSSGYKVSKVMPAISSPTNRRLKLKQKVEPKWHGNLNNSEVGGKFKLPVPPISTIKPEVGRHGKTTELQDFESIQLK